MQPNSSTSDGAPPCPKCKGIGYFNRYVEVGEPGFGDIFPCPWCKPQASMPRLQRIARLSKSELARRFEDIVTEGRPGTARMLAACRQFLDQPQHILTIHGEVGNGKTLAALALVNALNAARIEALYMRIFDLLEYLKQGFDASSEPRSDNSRGRLQRLANVRVLVLDDFDRRSETPWANEQVEHLIDTRHRLAEDGTAGTVIIMNADPALQPRRIASRLLDGRNRVVHNGDSDIRSALRA